MLTILAVAAIACNTLTVEAPRAYTHASGSVRIHAADFDGDGRLDVGMSTYERTFTIRYGTGGGKLSEALSFPYEVVGVADVVGNTLPDLLVYDHGVRENRGGRDFSVSVQNVPVVGGALAGDFTGDGRADILTPEGFHYTLLSYTTGTAQKVSEVDLGEFGRDLQAIDTDGDGDLDLITSHVHSSDYRIYSNDGRGNFMAGTVRYFEGWFKAADLDGDRRADRVGVVDRDGIYGGMHVFYANGSSAEVVMPEGTRAGSFDIHDLDGDGDPDLAVHLFERTDTQVYRNDRGTLVRVPQRLLVGAIAAAADFTGDGIPDLAASISRAVTIIQGNGDGTFRVPPPLDAPAPSWYSERIAADLDGDGLEELIYFSEDRRSIVARPDGAGRFSIELLPGGSSGYLFRASHGEIAVANYDGAIAIFTRGANGWTLSRSFEAPQLDHFELGDFELGDFNGDGRNELALITRTGNAHSLRIIDTTTRQVLLDQPLRADQAGYDVLAHGRLLIVTVSGTLETHYGDPPISDVLPDGSVTVYTFAAAGTPLQQTVLSGAAFHSTVAGDFNGDGRTDILSSDQLAYGRAGAMFAPAETVEGISFDRVAGDLNGDGTTDLVTRIVGAFTYFLGSPAGLQRAATEWAGVGGALPVIARLRAERPASMIFGRNELIEVRTQCVAPAGRRRGVRH